MAHNDSGFTVSINRHRVSVMSIAALVQSDESFSNVRLPQYLVNMVTAHHSLDKKKRHTSIDIDATSRFTASCTEVPVITLLIIRHFCSSVDCCLYLQHIFKDQSWLLRESEETARVSHAHRSIVLSVNSTYRISSKNSASLNFRHPFAQMG